MSSSDSSAILGENIALLDIPEPLVAEAVAAYEDIGAWLANEASPLHRHVPDLYPQGSFRLGTPVRPLRKRDEFDIDMVCKLVFEKANITQAQLKEMVGDRLKRHPEHGRNVDEHTRCWTMSFPERFTLDVLPVIPDQERQGTGILLTDTDYRFWEPSNPIAYSQWFFSRMTVQLAESRAALAKSLQASIEDVPEWAVRTPLQRSVQILKRHRDTRFKGPPEYRPLSIIITTLAAKAYRHESSIGDAVLGISARLADGVEKREGQWWVPNPALPEENFADGWNERPGMREAFFIWLDNLRKDVAAWSNAASENEARMLIEKTLGTEVAKEKFELDTSIPAFDDRSHIRAPLWPVNRRYQCAVEAEVFRGRRRSPSLGKMGKRILHKRAGLRFVATTDAPEPYEVIWQVSNSGAEARKAGQLRGGFEDGEGHMGTIRWEETSYRGTHLVEAFVIKGQEAVARSGPVEVRIAR